MKTPRIVNAIGYIDDDLIESAVCSQARRKAVVIKWSAVAACLIMALAAILTLPHMLKGNPPLPPDDLTVTEKYYDYGIKDGAFADYIGGEIIAEERIGNKIEDVIVTAGWKNIDGEWISVKELKAEVYEIEGVKRDIGAALKFIDETDEVSTSDYYEIMHPDAEYNGMVFPDYNKENPVRYLEEGDMGKYNGWQDFGANGEIQTITVPYASTYIYQMYSYYIRNDFRHIYAEEVLPDKLEDLPAWLADVTAKGRKSFWYSMGLRLPETVTMVTTSEIILEDGNMKFTKAEYKVHVKNGATEKEEDWVIYFMEEDGIYHAYAVIANENFSFVKSYTESIVKSYKTKQ